MTLLAVNFLLLLGGSVTFGQDQARVQACWESSMDKPCQELSPEELSKLADMAAAEPEHQIALNGEHALKFISDQEVLLRVARKGRNRAVRGVAIQKMDAQTLLAFACKGPRRDEPRTMGFEESVERISKCDKNLLPVVRIGSPFLKDVMVDQFHVAAGKQLRIGPGPRTVVGRYYDSRVVHDPLAAFSRHPEFHPSRQHTVSGAPQEKATVAPWAANREIGESVTRGVTRDTWTLIVRCDPQYPAECKVAKGGIACER